MAKFSGPSVLPGAQPELPTEGKVSDFAEILGAPFPEETTEAPQEAAGQPVEAPATIPTAPVAEAVTDDPAAPPPEQLELPGTRRQTMTVGIPEDPSAAQRQRERVPALTERMNRTTLAPAGTNQQPLDVALARADNVVRVVQEEVSGSKITRKKREALEAGTPEAAFAATDAEGNLQVPVAPLVRGSSVNVGAQAIFYDPRVFDAGKVDPETGMMGVDPDLARIMGLTTEAWLHQQMDMATEFAANSPDADSSLEMPADGPQPGGQRFTKASGNMQLGKEIFMAYKRQAAANEGKPTDAYLGMVDDISPETFTFIGDLAKEAYARANPDMLIRDDSQVEAGGQVYFQLTPMGAIQLDKLNNDFKGLMAQPEVKPLNGVSPTAQPIFEGRMRVRQVTTKMGDLGDWSVIQEAMANYHGVQYVNDPGREKLAYLFAMLALVNANNPDNQVYSHMFGVGFDKLQELQGIKQRMFDEAERETDPIRQKELYALAEAYNPAKILQSNREKFINVAGGVAEYSGQVNHLTFALQALTGRMHVQQTLYNPAAHKFLRFVAGSGNVFAWEPGKGGEIERDWKEIISAHLFSATKDGKVFKGTELSTAERIAAFDREMGGATYQQLVDWGNQLKMARDNFNVDAAKGAVDAIRKAQNPQEASGLKKQVVQDFSQDPLSAGLKAELAKHKDEAPMFASMLIELANYDSAVANKSKFSTTINPEMDGQTHGPATNAALLGVESMARRTGLIVEQDFSNTDWMDSRKAMGEMMQEQVDTYAGTMFSMDHLPHFKRMLDAAIKDRANFLKKSPMTMGYGQEIPSLKMHVETTVYSGPSSKEIQAIAAEIEVEPSEVVDFLHSMLVDSIFQIMDPKVVASGRLLKANAFLSMISNEVLYFDNALGFRSYAAGKQVVPEDTTQSSFEFKGPEGERKKVSVQFYRSRAEGSAVRPELGPGGWSMGRIIPTAVQSYDGNMVAKTGSGESWSRIEADAKKRGAQNTFVLPIFDAFVTDLGSFSAVRREANKNWYESIRDHSYMEQIGGVWFNETITKIRKGPTDLDTVVKMTEDGPHRGLAFALQLDENGNRNLIRFVSKTMQHPPKTPGQTIGEYQKSMRGLAKRMVKDFENRMLREHKIDVNATEFTKEQMNIMILDMVNMLQLQQRNRKAIDSTNKAKAEVLSKVTGTLTQMDIA